MLAGIWQCHNSVRFDNKYILPLSDINRIWASTTLTSNLSSACMSAFVSVFSILRSFGVKGNPKRGPCIIQVDWTPPSCGWIKENTDNVARGSPGHAAAGGIFRDRSGSVVGCFSQYLGISFPSTPSLLLRCLPLNLRIFLA